MFTKHKNNPDVEGRTVNKKGKIENTKKVFIFYTGDTMVVFLCINIIDGIQHVKDLWDSKRTVENLINLRKTLLTQSVFD